MLANMTYVKHEVKSLDRRQEPTQQSMHTTWDNEIMCHSALINPLATIDMCILIMQLWFHVISSGNLLFCASKKGGIEGCGCTYSHEVPCTWKLSVESCRKILAGTGWTISLLFSTETAPYFCRVSISGTAGSLQLGETFVGRKGSDYWKLANVGGVKVLNSDWLAQVSSASSKRK